MQGKVLPDRSAYVQVYVGIDVCKAWLDVFIHPMGQTLRVDNTAKGHKALVRALRKHKIGLLVMEATGKYHISAHRALHEAGCPVAVVNPLRARLYAEAKGILAKTDRVDARVLALMAQDLQPAAVAPAPQELEELQELHRVRQSAVDQRTALMNLLGETKGAFAQASLRRRIKALDGEIAKLEAETASRIKADGKLFRRYQILASIPGVGPVTATWLLVGMPELGSCTAKQAAMLVGLAPIARDSGQTSGPRHIRGGRGDVRSGIYMGALSATTCNPPLKEFYDRLTDAGKLHKVALTGVMRKMVILANSLLTEDRLWQPLAPKSA
jgi:transposase